MIDPKEADQKSALPRNCRRNEIHTMPLVPWVKGVGKAWRVGVAVSQETYLTDQITFPTEG